MFNYQKIHPVHYKPEMEISGWFFRVQITFSDSGVGGGSGGSGGASGGGCRILMFVHAVITRFRGNYQKKMDLKTYFLDRNLFVFARSRH